MVATDTPLEATVRVALDQVFDPEYPDLSIVDLGLLERISASPDGSVRIGLVPTFSGCPALSMIASDVRSAISCVSGVEQVSVEWLNSPVWSTERITPSTRTRLSSEYTVVLRRKDGTLQCPVCGSDDIADQSMASSTRCRSVAWCSSCRNPVEVMR